ncbi:uncharacterized protein LOC121272636 isoform X2 [Carcharodon carcharias]|uniref:uncharacterized protein LOC121272636 isoform X2 n=1 Tax=Carcharodon carcharias TaxID=13397 RepID=UPI001B7F6992|nr:uncharacterized protein LOC121272636 isoform X2 [Carcharodon carcharias]
MMLSGRPLYGAGDLVSRLSPQAKADHSLWVPLSPAGKGQRQGNGCCWRRAPLQLAEDSGRMVQLPGRHPQERLEGLGNMDAKRPTHLAGAVTRPTVKGKDRSCHGVGRTMEAGDGLYLRAGPRAEAEDGPCHPTGHTPEACVGPCHGVGPTTEAGGGPCHGVGPTAEAGGGPCDGAGPTAEAGGGPCHGVGHTVEAGVGPCHGVGPTAEAGGGPCHGVGPTAEAGGGPADGVGHTVEAECKAYHGTGRRQGGSFQDHALCACKDGAFEEQAEPHKHQWRDQNIQAVEGTVTKVTGLSETQEGTRLAGLVSLATGTVEGHAQLCDATQAGEKVGASDCEEHKEAEEHDDEFGSFEKAGNLVHWAEFPGPLGLECENLHEQSGTTAGWSQDSGPSNRATGSWQSTCPPTRVIPSHDLSSEGGWRAFHGEDRQTQESSFDAFPLNKWEVPQRGAGGKWWLTALERHTFQPTSSSESSLGSVGLEPVFRSCFPTISSTSSIDPIPTLGQLLGAEEGGEGFMSTQAHGLWGLLQNVDEAVGLKYKWSECQSRRHLLASLCVDPATMNSAPQLQNGFSPTHRIQAFFYHWTQADRNGKSKTSYDVNKNFMA